MSRGPRQQPITEVAARESYLADAIYFWLRAVGEDENMMSVLHRMGEPAKRQLLEAHGWRVPSAVEVHARAVAIFGQDRTHDVEVAPPRREGTDVTEAELGNLIDTLNKDGSPGKCEVCTEWLDDRGNCPLAHDHPQPEGGSQ